MYDLDINKFVENMKFYRKSRKLTLEQLGNKIGKAKATVSKYEKGEIIPDILTVLEICNALNISVSQLFPIEKKIYTKNNSYNPFFTNLIYMYHYTENLLVTSIIELVEDNNQIKLKFFNGVKDINKYVENGLYTYEGNLYCDKQVGYMELYNTETMNTLFEKIQISFLIPWSNKFEITNFLIMGLTPNAIPVVKKGIFSNYPITDFSNFKDDLEITDEELNQIKKNNNWLLKNKNYNHFYFDK